MTGMNARLVSLIVCAAAIVAACSRTTVAPSPDGTLAATVVSVTDGDTVTLRIAGRKEKVRLIGVNTPETKDRKSTRLNSSHVSESRMPSSA